MKPIGWISASQDLIKVPRVFCIRRWLYLGTTATFALGSAAAQSLDVEAKFASGGADAIQHSLLVSPGWKTRLGSALLDVELRIEVADDDVGLGAISGFSDASKPLLASEDARIEIERALLRFPMGNANLFLGKQVIAWGKLDGVRVTDAINPIRLNEFVLTQDRPERIGLWAARLRGDLGAIQYDFAFAPDPTVDQLANPGNLYFPNAPRYRGGLSREVPLPTLMRESRNDYIDDAVYGARFATTIGRVDLAASAISGPRHEALLAPFLDENTMPAVRLEHPRRTLVGATAAAPFGPTVIRLEAAVIPDEQMNTNDMGVVDKTEITRSLVGFGMDWNAPSDVFVNAQLVVDSVYDSPSTLVRDEHDVIGTIRIQRSFRNDRITPRLETLFAADEGDAVFRPQIEFDANDTFDLIVGADLFTGDAEGIFGQFADNGSRAWVSLKASF